MGMITPTTHPPYKGICQQLTTGLPPTRSARACRSVPEKSKAPIGPSSARGGGWMEMESSW